MAYPNEEYGAGSIQSDREALQSGFTAVQLWMQKIKHQIERDEKKWRRDARKAIDAYDAGEDKNSNFNLYHANVETLGPMLYNSTPIPDVRRRYADTDRVARMAAETVERGLNVALDQFEFDEVMEGVVQDGIIPGRGVARARADPVGEAIPTLLNDGTMADLFRYYNVYCELVPWDRLILGPGRLWRDIEWIAFEHDMTELDLRELGVSKERIDALGLGDMSKEDPAKRDDANKENDAGILQTIRAYEVWHKPSRRVIWVTERDDDEPLADYEDPFGIEVYGDFFPIPRPYQQIRRAGSMLPRCQYKIYEPLLDELNEVSLRIRKLIKTLRARAVADPSLRATMALLETADDGEVVTAQSADAINLGERALDQLVHHFPMDPTVKALAQLYQQREQLKGQIFEVTGISDILRGEVDSREKLGQSQIKAQSANLKLGKQQKEVQRFARDTFRLMAEIAVNLLPWQSIRTITRMDYGALPKNARPEENEQHEQLQQHQVAQLAAQTEADVRRLLKQGLKSMVIDIESDSTLRADLQRNQEQMSLMLQGSSQFLQALAAMRETMPEFVAPMMTVYRTTFLRQFQFGKEAEDALEAISEMPMQQQADPRIEELEQMVQQLQQELQKREMEDRREMAKIQSTERVKSAELKQQGQLEERQATRDQRNLMLQLGVQVQKEENDQARLEIDRDKIEIERDRLEWDKRSGGAERMIKAIETDTKADGDREERGIKREDMAERRKEQRQKARQQQQKKKAA